LVCDGFEDCSDGSDERGCNISSITCKDNQFACQKSRHCIPSRRRCDGAIDCEDGSDELNCTNIVSLTNHVCPEPSRSCLSIENNSMICLPIFNFCDGTVHCVNGTDEGGRCEEDFCFVGSQCKGHCHNVPEGHVCYCLDNLRLAIDGVSCTDAQPCEEWGICSQKCYQFKTHHRCDCEEDYQLESDGYTCKSIDPQTPYVIFSNRYEIRSVDLRTSSVRPLISGLKNTIALDFYYSPSEDLIFWTDVMDDKIYSGSVIHGSLTNIQVVVQTGLSTAEGLAVDWIGKNIYWIESNLDQIEVATLNGSFRQTLLAGDMESPRAIALDSRKGLLFWTDWDNSAPRIESASMSGEERKTIIRIDESDGGWPNGLTLDYVNERIYWIDARSHSISTVYYDGSDHHEILRSHQFVTHPFAISLFGNYIYWTDWRSKSVIRANKWNGTDIKVVQQASSQPFDIKIYHPSRQPRSKMTNPCMKNNGNCSHLCLLNVHNTYRCQCPHLMKLDTDGKTCLKNERLLLFSRLHEIKGVDLDQPYYHMIPPIRLFKVISESQINVDAKDQKIYWTDTKLNEVKRANLTGSGVETVIDTFIEQPHGFALDWVSKILFVTSQESATKAKIYVCNLNGEYIFNIIDKEVYNPKSLAVNPLEGKLFWYDHGVEESVLASITMANMDGSNKVILSDKSTNVHLNGPSHLVTDLASKPYRLYWVNAGSGTIQWMRPDSSNTIHTIWDDSAYHLEPHAIDVYKDMVLFSSFANSSINIISKENGSGFKVLRNQTSKLLSLRVFDQESQGGENSCSYQNGNCSHLCIPISATSRVCKCAIGFQIDPNNVTQCIGSKSFLMFSWNWGLQGISLDPQSNQTLLPPMSKILMATKIDFYHPEKYIFWVDSEDASISRIKTDTTHYEKIVTGLKSIEGIAVDWIAQNIYWIDSFYEVIEVARLNGEHRCVIISGDMGKPQSILVYPIKGYLFWTDVESRVKIERAFLDGSDRMVIFNESNEYIINDLAIDFETDKLYFCDSRLNRIERMNLDGSDKEIILIDEKMIGSPIALTIYMGQIYWADTNYKRGSIVKLINDTESGNLTSQVIRSYLGDGVKDIEVFHSRQINENNPCSKNNGNCQDLCFYISESSYRCDCAHGYLSPSDNRSCIPYDAFIIFSKVFSIESIHITDGNNYKAPYPSISNKEFMRNVIGLSFDYDLGIIIYSDIQKGSINSVTFNGSNHSELIKKQGSVEGIAYDSHNKELFWTSNSDASISRMNFQHNRRYRKIVKLTSEDKLRGIAVDGCQSKIYWTNWNTLNPSIQTSYTSGYEVKSIITTKIKMPNAITIDHSIQKLFWSDARLDKIERCNLDGTDRVVLLAKIPQHPFDLTVYGDYIFWTDWLARAVLRANKYTGSDLLVLRKNVPKPMGIVAVAKDADTCSFNPCLFLNGGCSDTCKVALNGTVQCSCFTNRVLLEDGQRCANVKAKCTHMQFQCGDGLCIPYELTCDGINNCKDKLDERPEFCAQRTCPEGFFSCSNDRCISMDKVCDGQNNCPDSADEANCSCPENMFKCTDGTCIKQHLRCDSDPDCSDASDEMNCPKPPCSLRKQFFNCENTTACLHIDWICDGQNDCWDWSDEKNCKPKSNVNKCSANSFRCDTGNCIPYSWVCDHDNDCEDGNGTRFSSDERNCEYKCQEDQFQCKNQDCIPSIWICDGNKDCQDGSDESEECTSRICENGTFKCNTTGQCIPQTWVCDSENDCGDEAASDEHPILGCNVSNCEPNEFFCKNYQCILKTYYCDGDDDCGDGSDEPPDCAQTKCNLDQFECKDKRCIPKLWMCNGIVDCPDESDEDVHLCNNNKTSSRCQEHEFECENQVCISVDVLCDGVNNCGDYSDESRCNLNECESGFACAQKCEDMPIGYKCSCYDGFQAIDGGKICKDIDECKIGRPCSQYCRNTHGSYACSCASGYYSLNNGTSCKAVEGNGTYLIYSDHHYIIQIDASGHTSHFKVANITNAVALDFYWDEKCIYWSDMTPIGSTINRICESNNSTIEIIIHSNMLKSPDGLAVDWVGKNLYWCDKAKRTIEVATLNGKFQKVLISENLEEPKAITLDPTEGYLYWTDWGENSYIGKAGMDGSEARELINTSLAWPNALTIDYVTRELFWADAKEDYISVADLNGQKRALIVNKRVSKSVGHVFSMTTFEDHIFWTDWETMNIEKCHKYNCRNSSTIAKGSHRPMGIHVYHPFRQPVSDDHSCDFVGCTALCLLKPGAQKVEGVCDCPTDFVLDQDGFTCLSNCSSDQFVCSQTMKCIPKTWLCDKQDDCGDGSDEANCQKKKCENGHFHCNNSKCVLSSLVCDGVDQCGDNSDEVNCRKYFNQIIMIKKI